MTIKASVVTVATSAPVDEVQTITVDATGGTFTVSFGGQTTAALAFDVSAADLQTALQGLSSIGSGNATVSGTAPYTVTFAGTLAGTNVAQLTTNAASLTGNTHSATVATSTPGAPRTSPQALTSARTSPAKPYAKVYVRNTGGSTVYLGGSTVTTSTGFPLAASTTFPLDLNVTDDGDLYAIVADGGSTTVAVLETGLTA